jgi:hypothetical protein
MMRGEIAERMASIEAKMERLAQRARTANTKRYRDYLKEKFLELFTEHRNLWKEDLYQTITGPSRETKTKQQYPDGEWSDDRQVFNRPIRTTGEMYGPNSIGWRQ